MFFFPFGVNNCCPILPQNPSLWTWKTRKSESGHKDNDFFKLDLNKSNQIQGILLVFTYSRMHT